MKKKQIARPSASTLERARKAASGNLRVNHTISFESPQYNFLLQILPHGEENGISAADLKKKLGLSDKRVLRHMVERARTSGAVILSGDHGYYLPSDNPLRAALELKRFLRARDACLRTNRSATRSARQAYERLKQELSGQVSIAEAVYEQQEESTVSEEII